MMEAIINNNKISAIGFGTWLIDSEEIILEAIKAGYRHIDTAQMYKNEQIVGAAINTAISKRIISSYEDIFVTSKLWVSKFDKWTMKSNDILNSIYTSRERINQEYIDLMLIHWPTYHDIKIVMDGMMVAKDRGIIKNIGVSNFNILQLEEANSYLQKEYGENITCNQIELNLYYENKDIISYCHKNNILVSAYSPLGSRAEYHLSEIAPIGKDIQIMKIGVKYKKTPQQVILRYLSQKGNIVILPSSKIKEHIIDNLDIDDFLLDKEDIDILDSYPKNMSVIYEKYKDIIYKS